MSHIHTTPHTSTASIIINLTHQNGTFSTKDAPILTHHDHPKSIALGVAHSMGLDKRIMTCVHYNLTQSMPTAPQSSVLCLFIVLSAPTLATTVIRLPPILNVAGVGRQAPHCCLESRSPVKVSRPREHPWTRLDPSESAVRELESRTQSPCSDQSMIC